MGRSSKFLEFVKNPIARNLLESYEKGEIKSVKELNEELAKKGIKISSSTLYNYLAELKVLFFLLLFILKKQDKPKPIPKSESEKVCANIRYERGISKFDNNNVIIVGTDGEQNWRKFRSFFNIFFILQYYF